MYWFVPSFIFCSRLTMKLLSGFDPQDAVYFKNRSGALKRKKPLVRLFAERPSQKPIVKDIYRSTSAGLKRFSQ